MKLILIIFILALTSCGFTINMSKDDQTPIYLIPFEEDRKVLMVQASKSLLSHRNEIAVDFMVKKGTKIFAARSGTVIATKEDSDKHGLSLKYLSEGNHIIIQHEDSSIAWYWHLQKDGVFVETGDSVSSGQLIGASGHTGYSAFPHLHFEVRNKEGRQVYTRFYTQDGVEYLKAGRFYKAIRP